MFGRVVMKVVYWVAVVAISLALLVVLVRFFESRDDSQLDGAAVHPGARAALTS